MRKLPVNGFMLREALKYWDQARQLASSMFSNSLYAFEGEVQESPVEIMRNFEEADVNYARIQSLQQKYNDSITVDVQGSSISLSTAVKLIGGAGRVEKMWRLAVNPPKSRYDYDDRQRERGKDREYAVRTISQSDALELATDASRRVSALRTAIATANNREMDVSEFLSEEDYNHLLNI